LSALQDETVVELTEGKAKLQLLPTYGKVFYNSRMSFNRDLAVLFASSYFSSTPKARVCDPMAGSGVRAVRYLLETSVIEHVVAGDRQALSAELAQETIRMNGVGSKASVVHRDAHTLLSQHSADRFDLIDLDPFGSPAPFFESALRATAAGGVIAATATDMGPLSGARPAACKRKYGISPLRTEFEKEIAVRTLASCLSAAACRMELGIDIAFSHATDHYARLYALVIRGRKAANRNLAYLQYLAYCPTCLFRTGKPSISSLQNRCANCGAPALIGGPFWFGPLWDRRIVDEMARHTPTLATSRFSEVEKTLNRIQGESHAPKFYYTTDAIASKYSTKPPSIASLLQSLRDLGFQATRTHFNPVGFRTNAPIRDIIGSFRTVAEKSQT
jgi:tRNA (guanine26-N2/guanine27-N2)-dimethyltransferase